jgi:hypothetical protein
MAIVMRERVGDDSGPSGVSGCSLSFAVGLALRYQVGGGPLMMHVFVFIYLLLPFCFFPRAI